MILYMSSLDPCPNGTCFALDSGPGFALKFRTRCALDSGFARFGPSQKLGCDLDDTWSFQPCPNGTCTNWHHHNIDSRCGILSNQTSIRTSRSWKHKRNRSNSRTDWNRNTLRICSRCYCRNSTVCTRGNPSRTRCYGMYCNRNTGNSIGTRGGPDTSTREDSSRRRCMNRTSSWGYDTP
jgi:hypothetical protein